MATWRRERLAIFLGDDELSDGRRTLAEAGVANGAQLRTERIEQRPPSPRPINPQPHVDHSVVQSITQFFAPTPAASANGVSTTAASDVEDKATIPLLQLMPPAWWSQTWTDRPTEPVKAATMVAKQHTAHSASRVRAICFMFAPLVLVVRSAPCSASALLFCVSLVSAVSAPNLALAYTPIVIVMNMSVEATALPCTPF